MYKYKHASYIFVYISVISTYTYAYTYIHIYIICINTNMHHTYLYIYISVISTYTYTYIHIYIICIYTNMHHIFAYIRVWNTYMQKINEGMISSKNLFPGQQEGFFFHSTKVSGKLLSNCFCNNEFYFFYFSWVTQSLKHFQFFDPKLSNFLSNLFLIGTAGVDQLSKGVSMLSTGLC